MPPKAKPKPKIKIKVKKLSKKQLEIKARECLKNLQDTYKIIQAKFQHIIKGCTEGKDKETLKKDLYETVHIISFLLSKSVPLELRNSPNDRSKQLKDLLNTWIKESSSKKDKGKSISYTSLIKSFIETCLTPEGKLRFSRTKKNSNSLYRALDARNIINPTADDTQCDIAFGTDQWPATHKCYICGLCLHNMQSDNCGAPCEHLLNIYQVMITFGFIETEDRQTFDINEDDRKNIYAPSCTCCNSEKSNIEIISFKNNKWQVNEKNVEKILKQVKDSKRDCCYKNGHPDEPEKPGDRDDQAVWVKPSKKDNDKCSTTNVAFPGETETRPLYDNSDTAINNRKKEIVFMLEKRVAVLKSKVPRPKATSNLPYLNAIIQIATFFTHISLNAYKKMATEMAGRTVLGGAPPAAGAGDDNIYELCSDADADCFDIEVYENIFKKEFENHFWEEFQIGVNNTTFDDTSTIADNNTSVNINLLISTLSNKNTEIKNITTDEIKHVYDYLLEEDHRIQEEVEKKKQVLQEGTTKFFKNIMLDELPKPEDYDRSVSPVIPIAQEPIAQATESSNMSPPSSDTEDPNSSQDYSSDNSQRTYGYSSDSQFGTEDVNPYSSESQQPYGVSSGDDNSPIRPKFYRTGTQQTIKYPLKINTYPDADAAADAEVAEVSDFLERNQKSQKTTPISTPGSRTSSVDPETGRTSSTFGFKGLSVIGHESRPTTPGFRKTGSTPTFKKATRSTDRQNMLGGKKTRKNKTKKQNKTRKQKPKKQTKRIYYVKNKQTRKNKKRIKKSNSKKAT